MMKKATVRFASLLAALCCVFTLVMLANGAYFPDVSGLEPCEFLFLVDSSEEFQCIADEGKEILSFYAIGEDGYGGGAMRASEACWAGSLVEGIVYRISHVPYPANQQF